MSSARIAHRIIGGAPCRASGAVAWAKDAVERRIDSTLAYHAQRLAIAALDANMPAELAFPRCADLQGQAAT
jgi:hypothetical protein